MSYAPDLSQFSKQEIKDILADVRHPVEVAIFGSENGFNTGAIIRTSHQFLVSKIHLIDMDWWYKRADMGTRKWENIQKSSLKDFLLLSEERSIVAFERRESLPMKDLRTFTYPKDPIFVFGSEKTGVPDLLLDRAQSIVSIPQFGLLNDLNLSVAVGIALYDWSYKHYMK